MIGRPREFDREAALETAMMVFWRKGYAASSMIDLCDAMGVRSPSLYAAFGCKEDLYLEAIKRYVDIKGPRVWNHLEETATAQSGVSALLTMAAEFLPKSGVEPGGCMAATAATGDEWPLAIRRAVKKIRAEMFGRLRSRFERAVAEGELSQRTDIDGLSRFYLSIYLGMAIQARDGAAATELKGLAESAMAAWPHSNKS